MYIVFFVVNLLGKYLIWFIFIKIDWKFFMYKMLLVVKLRKLVKVFKLSWSGGREDCNLSK